MIRGSLLFLLILMGVSCSDRYEYFDKVNRPPSIRFVKESDSTTDLTDSIKISRFPYYPIKLELTDSTSEIASLRFKVMRGKGQLFYKNSALKSHNLNAQNSLITLKWVPADSGLHELAFTATDRFEKSQTATLRLLCFTNLPPVARLKVLPLKEESPLEFLLDASNSYDEDKKWGGHIVSYCIRINGVTINTTQASAKYIFPNPGTYQVFLTVKDDQGVSSPEREVKIEVEK